MKSEQQIQRAILSYLKSLGIYAIKTIRSNRGGVPDIIACAGGRFIALEVKRPGNKATALQQLEIARIEAAGGIAAVVYSKEDAAAILSDFITQTTDDMAEGEIMRNRSGSGLR